MTLTEKMRLRDELSQLLYRKTETQLRKECVADSISVYHLDLLVDLIERKLAAAAWTPPTVTADNKTLTCASCGLEMDYQVSRLGDSGGYIHKATGRFECSPPKGK